MPKLDDGTKKQKNKLIKSCGKSFGECPSRDEGIRRSFNTVVSGEQQFYQLTLQGVGDLNNVEWQGPKSKQDPCYLRVVQDVLGCVLLHSQLQ
jgi:hypothetical protein